MTQRVTNADIDAVRGRYVRACQRLEMVPDGGFRLDVGSKTYGRSYRLYASTKGSPAPGTSSGYLGMTKREAYDSLMIMALTLEAVLHHKGEL